MSQQTFSEMEKPWEHDVMGSVLSFHNLEPDPGGVIPSLDSLLICLHIAFDAINDSLRDIVQ